MKSLIICPVCVQIQQANTLPDRIMNSALLIPAAEKALTLIFNGIDGQVKGNIRRVLEIYCRHRVGVRHFCSVSGYGHDDLGRETLDKVFAEIMGAEAAAVRVVPIRPSEQHRQQQHRQHPQRE